MASIKHPFDPESLYQLDDDGNIRITRGNAVGVFTTEGIHISGEIKQADPQLCVWIGNNPDPETAFQRAGRSSHMAKRS